MKMGFVSVTGGVGVSIPTSSSSMKLLPTMVCFPNSINIVKNKINPINFQIKNQQNCASTPSIDVVKVKGVVVVGRSGGGGAGLLERPPFDQSQSDPSTQVLEGGDIGRLRDKRGIGSGDSYRVLLLDDARHSEKLVAKVIPEAVPSVTPDDARRLFHESRDKGVAVVIVTVKEHAEFYSQMMMRGGLRSGIEPDSSTV